MELFFQKANSMVFLKVSTLPVLEWIRGDLAAIEQEAFAPNPYLIDYAYTYDNFKNMVRAENETLIVAMEDLPGQVVMGYVSLFRDEYSNYEVSSLAVRSKWRGQGIGKALLKHAINDLHNTEITRAPWANWQYTIYLHTPADKIYGSVDFYIRNGFNFDSVVNDYYEVGKHAIKLTRDARFTTISP
jgi:ribosomal protein S18 acetylase RimI-like enzyme